MRRPVRIGALLAIVFVGAVALGWVAITLLGPLIPTRAPDPATRPTPNAVAPFTLTLSVAGGSPQTVVVSTDADCSALQASESFFEICSLAVNADPAVIGGAAFGKLNSGDTPSLGALTWRARADGDPAVCAAGGLLEARLTTCQAQAVDPGYQLTDAGLTVKVPIAP